MSKRKPTYRPDIDGLRAIAVTAVVLFHVSEHLLPNGFLGVDVFFVISGYLITGIIWADVLAGKFSILRFYERRLRRIGPALLVMLVTVSAASCLLLLPTDLIKFARSLLSTLAFVSNIFFYTDTNYFGGAAGEKPLLHTWSLGIEEQFYILFPLVLTAAVRWHRSRAVWIVLILALLSLALNIIAIHVGAQNAAFYLLPTRAWELGAGALLAFVPASAPRLSRQVSEGLAASSALLLLASLVSAPLLSRPLPPAVWSVAATTMLIFIGRTRKTHTHAALGLALPRYVGLISYSLYLWHWPILVLARYYASRELTPAETLAAVALMFVLAHLSWRYVEQPFRVRTTSIRTVIGTCGAAALSAASLAALILFTSGLPQRLSPNTTRLASSIGDIPSCDVEDTIFFAGSHACSVNLPSRDPSQADVVLLGNSHAQMYLPIFRDFLARNRLTGLLVRADGCAPWTGPNVDPSCTSVWRRNIASVAALKHVRVVIVAFYWQNVDERMVDEAGNLLPSHGPEIVLAALERTIATLQQSGKFVVVVGPIATPEWEVASIAARRAFYGRPLKRALSASQADFLAHYQKVITTLSSRRDIDFVRPDIAQCQDRRCYYVIDGRALFADSNHLSTFAMARFAPSFEGPLERALVRSGLKTTSCSRCLQLKTKRDAY